MFIDVVGPKPKGDCRYECLFRNVFPGKNNSSLIITMTLIDQSTRTIEIPKDGTYGVYESNLKGRSVYTLIHQNQDEKVS